MLRQLKSKIKSIFGIPNTSKEMISVYMENNLGHKFWVDKVVCSEAIKLGKVYTAKDPVTGELISGRIVAIATTYARKGENFYF